MAKQSIKSESLKRLRTLVAAYGTDEDLYSSQQYHNLMHFFNKYEKENAELMVELIRKGYNNQTIIKTINERTKEMEKKNESPTKKNDNPVVTETEKIFIGYRMSDGPVTVEIGNTASDDTSDANRVDSADEATNTGSSEKPKEDTTQPDEYIISNDPAIRNQREQNVENSETPVTESEVVTEKKAKKKNKFNVFKKMKDSCKEKKAKKVEERRAKVIPLGKNEKVVTLGSWLESVTDDAV